MTDESSPTPEEVGPDDSGPATDVEPDWVRRKRLAAVFGDVLPDQTSDDRAPSSHSGGKGDDWYRGEVPPHHG